MANADFASGLKPVRLAAGTGYACPLRRYIAPSSYAQNLFIGDPVTKSGTADADGYQGVVLSTAGATNAITGVIVGFDDYNSLLVGYGAASTTRGILVADDPDTLFEIQEDAVGGTLALADVGLNADLIAATGSTSTRTSGWMLDTSTKATGATLQLKIIEFQHRVDVEPAVSKSKVLVKINLHTEAPGTAGI